MACRGCFVPQPCSPAKENNPPFPPINLSLVLKAVSFPTFFQLSLLCLSDPQMPSYFFSKARPLFLSFANLLFSMQHHSTQFSPFLLFPPLSPLPFPSLLAFFFLFLTLQERSALSFLFWRSAYETWPPCCKRLSSGTVHDTDPQALKITRSAV